MKKLFIAHTRFMALPFIISVGVRMVNSYIAGTLTWKEAGAILVSGALLMLLLFPGYLLLRAVWHRLAKAWRAKA